MRGWRKSIPGGGNGKCKHLEVGVKLAYSRTSRKASVAKEEKEKKDVMREVGMGQTVVGLVSRGEECGSFPFRLQLAFNITLVSDEEYGS